MRAYVDRLAAARIGLTHNQYAASELRRSRLRRYLVSRRHAEVILVGEAAGYRGARVSGLPFTSERQLTGKGPAEASATIVHRVLAELGIEDEVLLWNVVPTHPHQPDRPYTNRRPTRDETSCHRWAVRVWLEIQTNQLIILQPHGCQIMLNLHVHFTAGAFAMPADCLT